MNDESQHEEFTRIIQPYFKMVTPKYRICVELGCHGKENSNTWNLVQEEQWHTLWVDGSRRAIEQCMLDRGGAKISVFQAVLVPSSKANQPVKIWQSPIIGHDSTVQGWKDEEQEDYEEVLGVPLYSVFERYQIPLDFDFLSVDLEGVDALVCMDMVLYTEYRPQSILIENQGNLSGLFFSAMKNAGYFLVARNDVNDFWVREPR